MYISKLVIRNFRNFRRASFRFRPGVNTIIGENGSGKTNVFHALRLLLDPTLTYDSRKLVEKDFNRSLSDWKGHWIIITAFFSQLGTTEAEKLLVYGLGDGASTTEGSYSLIFRPNLQFRSKLHEIKTKAELSAALKELKLSDYEAPFLCKGDADFSDDAVYEELVGNFETVSFPDPSEQQLDKIGTKSPDILSIQKEISCTYVQALRDVVRELKSYSRNPLLNLLAKTGNIAESAQCSEISKNVAELNLRISNLKEIQQLSARITQSLKDAVGKTYSPGVSLVSSMPEEITELVKSLTVLVGDAGDQDYRGRLNELSLGGANLLYLSLKLLEYELNYSEEKVAHFLLIEEPEAHIHKHIQRTLFERMPLTHTQVFLSTHSTQISSACRISQMNSLCIEDKQAKVYFPGNGLSEEELIRIERYLDSTRVALLFAKGVLLVEGDAEEIVIPALLKQVLGISADELGLSIVNVSGSVFSHLGKLFDAKRIPRFCSIITDHDQSIVTLPIDASQDTEQQKKHRNSAKSGEQRKNSLQAEFSNNQFVKLCFAKHTFEVDFLLSDNTALFVEVLNTIYKPNSRDKSESRTKLEDSSNEIKGSEVLRLADKCGKGWFGILVAEKITPQTTIPRYILEAILFAARKQLTPEVLWDMAQHRLAKLSDVNILEYVEVSTNLREQGESDTVVEQLRTFSASLPLDPVSVLFTGTEGHADTEEFE